MTGKSTLVVLSLVLMLVLAGCKPVPAPVATPSPSFVPTPPGYVNPELVESSDVIFTSEGNSIKAYLSKPRTAGKFPGLIVIHENRGLTPHIPDVVRRFANQGYVALGPDLLSRIGGTTKFSTTDEAVAAIGTLSSDGVMADLNAAFNYLKSRPDVQPDHIGVIGYCWGGGNSLLFATRNSSLAAVVVYYGPNPANMGDVANIKAPVLGIYGEADTRISMNVPALVEAMQRYNKPFEHKIYTGAAHAFFNDTGTRYHPEAAAKAWEVTLSFLQKHLKNR